MRFNVDRICELAGLGAATGGLLSEAASAPAAKPAAAKPLPTKPAPAAAAGTAAAKPVAEDDYHSDLEPDMEEGYEGYGHHIEDGEMYEIDEMDLMEALVGMRQQRLEEASVRDAVRDEIKRALSDRGASWVYGSNKPAHSRVGQVSRGGFGIGFK